MTDQLGSQWTTEIQQNYGVSTEETEAVAVPAYRGHVKVLAPAERDLVNDFANTVNQGGKLTDAEASRLRSWSRLTAGAEKERIDRIVRLGVPAAKPKAPPPPRDPKAFGRGKARAQAINEAERAQKEKLEAIKKATDPYYRPT